MPWSSRRGRHDRLRHRRLIRRLRVAGASHAVCSTVAAAGSLSCARRGLMLMIDAWPSAGAATS